MMSQLRVRVFLAMMIANVLAMLGVVAVYSSQMESHRERHDLRDGATMRGDEVLVTADIHVGICDDAGRPTRPPEGFMHKLAALGN